MAARTGSGRTTSPETASDRPCERCHSSRVPERIPSRTKSPKPPSSSPSRQAQVPCATFRPSSSSARSRWASSEMMTASGYCRLTARPMASAMVCSPPTTMGRPQLRAGSAVCCSISVEGRLHGRPARSRSPGRPGRRRTGRRRGAGCSSRCCGRPGGRPAAPCPVPRRPEPVRSSGAPNRKKPALPCERGSDGEGGSSRGSLLQVRRLPVGRGVAARPTCVRRGATPESGLGRGRQERHLAPGWPRCCVRYGGRANAARWTSGV